MTSVQSTQQAIGALSGLRVLELSGHEGDFCGKLMADMGADVIKIETPGGEASRFRGPFYNDTPDRNRSLWFWHYNTSKRGITLDLETAEGPVETARAVRRHTAGVSQARLSAQSWAGLRRPVGLKPRPDNVLLDSLRTVGAVAGLQAVGPDSHGSRRTDGVLRLRRCRRCRRASHGAGRRAVMAHWRRIRVYRHCVSRHGSGHDRTWVVHRLLDPRRLRPNHRGCG